MKGRAVPAAAPPAKEQEHAERRAALLSLDPAQMRAWAEKWKIPLLDCSDADLVNQMHAARLRDTDLPAAARLVSLGVLAAQGDPVALATHHELYGGE